MGKNAEKISAKVTVQQKDYGDDGQDRIRHPASGFQKECDAQKTRHKVHSRRKPRPQEQVLKENHVVKYDKGRHGGQNEVIPWDAVFCRFLRRGIDEKHHKKNYGQVDGALLDGVEQAETGRVEVKERQSHAGPRDNSRHPSPQLAKTGLGVEFATQGVQVYGRRARELTVHDLMLLLFRCRFSQIHRLLF